MSTPGQPRERRKRRPPPPPVGKVCGPDGAERDVYQDADGRQYVLGPQGEKVYGLWLLSVPAPAPAPAQETPPDDEEPAPDLPLEEATAAEERPWEQAGERRDSVPHRGRMLALLGVAAFCLGVMGLPSGVPGVPGLALALYVRSAARRDLKMMEDGSMDPQGASQTQAALHDATVAAVLSGAGLVLAAVVAVGLLFYLT